MVDAKNVEQRLAELNAWRKDVKHALNHRILCRGDQIGYRAQLARVRRQIAMLTEDNTQKT